METKLQQLSQDVHDLLALSDTRRCRKCKRYYLPGYVCYWCGADNSVPEDE